MILLLGRAALSPTWKQSAANADVSVVHRKYLAGAASRKRTRLPPRVPARTFDTSHQMDGLDVARFDRLAERRHEALKRGGSDTSGSSVSPRLPNALGSRSDDALKR
jgi:hypothetical protein